MRIYKNALTSLVSGGANTLQIPDIFLGDDTDEEEIEAPDDWFCRAKYVGSDTRRRTPSYGPATGNEQGFLFYTTKGWEANKESLGEAYKAACKDGKYRGNLFNDREYVNGKLFINGKETPEGTPFVSDGEAETLWIEFEQSVEHHFGEFKKNLDKELMKAQLKLKYAKKYETPRTVAYWRRKVTELTNFVV